MAALFKHTKMYIAGMVIVNLISVLQFVNLHYIKVYYFHSPTVTKLAV